MTDQSQLDVIAILERQAATLAELADLAQSQRDAARQGDVDAVDRLLDQRRAIVETLAEVELELASIGESLERARSNKGEGADLLSKSRALAGEIAERDALTLSDLSAIRDEISSQITDTDKGRRAGAAYAYPADSSPELRISA